MVFFAVSTASANIFATNPSGSWQNLNPSGGYGNTLGIPFTVGASPVSVTTLGFFDELGNGLDSAHTVGIYALSQTLLGSVTIPSGTSAVLHDGTRWTDLGAPITLDANTGYVLAFTLLDSGDRVNDAFLAQVTIDPLFSLSGTGFTFAEGTSLQYPAAEYVDPFFDFDAFGGNLQATAIPEPKSWLLLSIPAVVASCVLRRRSRSC